MKKYLKKNSFIRTSYINFYALLSKLRGSKHTDCSEYVDSDLVNKLNEDGYIVLRGLFNHEEVNLLKKKTIEHLSSSETINNDGDFRRFCAEKSNEISNIFSSNKVIKKYKKAYLGYDSIFDSTLAGHLTYTKNNKGSGAGWHRDSYIRQVKSIVYLTDVELENGPFEYLVSSHKRKNVIRDANFLSKIADGGHNQIRYTNNEIEIIKKEFGYESKLITGRKGDVVIADTRGLHRGSPIISGERIALTNYCRDLSLSSLFS